VLAAFDAAAYTAEAGKVPQALLAVLPGVQAVQLKKAAYTALVTTNAEFAAMITPSLIQGFEAASRSGPLASEPCRGVIWEILGITGDMAVLNTWSGRSAMTTACRAAFVNANARIYEPMLMVDLQTEGHMAKVQAVLGQRRAEILESDMIDGNYSEHVIKAEVPAVEIFRDDSGEQCFTDALRSAARGKIVWTMAFSQWRIMEDDPFVEGTLSRRMLIDLRKRKGLFTAEKIVAVAEKQRTLTRNK
jgi:translation elongation factor EF-G